MHFTVFKIEAPNQGALSFRELVYMLAQERKTLLLEHCGFG